MIDATLIVPFYRNCRMLERQLQEWELYQDGPSILVIDDGSPEPAEAIIRQASPALRGKLRLLRITVDIPWNREGARNLGARLATSSWLIHVDIDHVLPAESWAALRELRLKGGRWYRFPRWRVGRADATRRKDRIPEDWTFGEIHPHIDSYLIDAALFWGAGGYDEDFSGVLGGGSDFLRRLEARAPVGLLPAPVCLHVYTRDRIADASDWSLSRDTRAGKEIARRKARERRVARAPLRFPWVEVAL